MTVNFLICSAAVLLSYAALGYNNFCEIGARVIIYFFIVECIYIQ